MTTELLTTERIFSSKEFDSSTFGPARWLEEDDAYTTLEPAPSDPKVKEIVRYAATGTGKRTLVKAEQLRPPGADEPLIISSYQWSPDQQSLLLFTNTKRVWRQETRGDYWLLNLQTNELRKLGGDAPPATLMFAKFSPDGDLVAYVRQNNIYVETITSGEISELTKDGCEQIINGTSDWVYEEEFKLRDAFMWSPRGRFIAYWQFDTSKLQPFYLINNTDTLYPQLTALPYPKVGTDNSRCRVGVAAVDGGETIWFDLPGKPGSYYVPRMAWAPNGKELLIQHVNRLQNRNVLFLGSAVDGSTRTIMVEEDPAWVDIHDGVQWLENGQAFTWLSDRDGWSHLYIVSPEGQATLLTPEAYEVIKLLGLDESSGWAYYLASPENPAQRYLYRSSLDGSGRTERITPPACQGTNSYQLSPDAKHAIHTFSSFSSPPSVSLISLPDHGELSLLEDNEDLREAVNHLRQPELEFFQLSMDEGLLFDGWCLKPPDFDPRRKYPLLFYVYGEPAGQTVLDHWGRKRKLWHMMLAQRGYLVMSVDNRGTPAPRGRAWRKSPYRLIGGLTTADQARAAEKLIATRPYIDADRVGVWGWSGGGTMTLNLLLQYPHLYKTGIAVAAVSDLRYYDTIYQERYMGLPEDNPEGYRNGSPISFASELMGNLLLIHGTGDDNVHYQCFEAMVNELIKHDKQFSVMTYPNRSHAIKEGTNTQKHLYSLMTRFLEANLMNLVGAKPANGG